MGEAEQWARKGESLGSRVVSEDVHSLEDGRPEDLALYTDDKDERSGNQQPQGIQGTRAQSALSVPAQVASSSEDLQKR